MSVFRRYAFRMKLYAMNRMPLVHDTHDHSVIGVRRDLEVAADATGVDCQRMVARGHKIVIQALEYASAVMMDARDFAMNGLGRTDNAAAIDLTNGLVAQADAQDGHDSTSRSNKIEADAGLVWRARPRRQHNRFRTHCKGFGDSQFVVSLDDYLCSQLSEIVEQVVGEAVVIIDQKQQFRSFPDLARVYHAERTPE